jgi:hypothetical protein
VKVQQGDDEAAAARYQESSEQLARLLPSRELASIASLRLARRALAARKLDDTLKRFSEVRNLTILAARLPEGLEDLPTAFAVEALQDDRVPDAADRFQRAAAAAEPGSDQALAARLGILLCRWRQRGGPLPEGFQDELAATAEQVRAGIGAAEPDDGDDPDERRLLLRNVLPAWVPARPRRRAASHRRLHVVVLAPRVGAQERAGAADEAAVLHLGSVEGAGILPRLRPP